MLRVRSVALVGPDEGETAEGEWGVGRMAEPEEIAARVAQLLAPPSLAGKRVLVTAGGTREPVDSVRFLGNRSSGRMGVALAEEARKRGADVTLLAANLAVPAPAGVEVIETPTAQAMLDAVLSHADADLVLMAAAVADYRPREQLQDKRAKDDAAWQLTLEPTTDILRELGARRENGQVLVGFPADTLRLCVLCLVAEGHLILEDFPGVGKTMLAKALARSLDVSFSRLQFTPDLLPSDVTGVSVFNQRANEFEFRPGPVFANLLLVDEINRASPKTQAALLECMQENQVTVDGVTYEIARPFLVTATQNPIEYEGTYPLPEAQLDRFTLRVAIGYPPLSEEAKMLSEQTGDPPLDALEPVAGSADAVALADEAKVIFVEESLTRYVVALLRATRGDSRLYLGASPRAGIALLRVAKARALADGRSFLEPDDIKAVAVPVLAHRLILAPEARSSGLTGERIVQETLEKTPVPV